MRTGEGFLLSRCDSSLLDLSGQVGSSWSWSRERHCVPQLSAHRVHVPATTTDAGTSTLLRVPSLGYRHRSRAQKSFRTHRPQSGMKRVVPIFVEVKRAGYLAQRLFSNSQGSSSSNHATSALAPTIDSTSVHHLE